MSTWMLVTYMLNPHPAALMSGQDPHIISQIEFRTRELCDQAREHQARQDATNGMASQFAYKCVARKTQRTRDIQNPKLTVTRF
jgi:hypothetical protein